MVKLGTVERWNRSFPYQANIHFKKYDLGHGERSITHDWEWTVFNSRKSRNIQIIVFSELGKVAFLLISTKCQNI